MKPTHILMAALTAAPTTRGQGGNTITVHSTGSVYPAAPGGTRGAFRTGQDADLMLSGVDFNNTGGPLLFNHCSHVASDGTRVVVCDRNNNRVLIWNTPPKSNVPPDLVLGQPDFIQNTPGAGLGNLNWPMAAAIAGGRLVVADTNNDRLLIWNTAPVVTAQPADFAISLPAYSQGGTQPSAWPWGVWTDGTRLLCTATMGAALMVWNTFPTATSPAPSFLLRDPAFGTPRSITCDGARLVIDDHNTRLPPTGGPGMGLATYFWNSFPTSATGYHSFARRGDRLRGGMTGGKLVLLGGNKLTIYNTFPASATTVPDVTVNGSWNGDGIGMAVADGCLYTIDENLNRLLVFNSLPATPAAVPDFAIGSPSVTTNTLTEHFFMQNPAVVTDGTTLWVGSDFDRRLCVWQQRPDVSGAYPDLYYNGVSAWAGAWHADRLVMAGQQRVWMWNQAPKNGEMPDTVLSGSIGGVTPGEWRGVALDARFLYLADYQQKRIHLWNGLPGAATAPAASITLTGQPGRISSDGTWLAVPVSGPHSVQLYRVADFPGTLTPFVTLTNGGTGQPGGTPGGGFNLPGGVLLDGRRLWVADTSFNRVLGWSSMSRALANQPADIILGAAAMSDVSAEIGRNKLFMPASLAWDGDYLWVGEFKFASRLLRFSPQPVGLELRGYASGQFNLRVKGAPGQNFDVQTSGNLADWQTIQSTAIPDGASAFDTNVSVPAGAARFFVRAADR